jgi:hypothetical protein
VLWSEAEPVEGQIDWEALADLEVELQTASEQGYEVILIIRNAPDWAQTIEGLACGPIKQEKFTAFANFVNTIVTKYSAPPYNVKYWELGNEPDVVWNTTLPEMPFGCWGDEEDPYYGGPYYAEMLKVVSPQIKAADPDAQVLVGGLLLYCNPQDPPQKIDGTFADCTPAKFLEGIIQSGGGEYFDGVSFHSYDYYWDFFPMFGNGTWNSRWNVHGPALTRKVAYLRSLLAIYGYPDKYLMLSETGLLCGSDGREAKCLTDDFNQTKALFLAQTYLAAQTEGLRSAIWYSITGWRGTGLVDNNMTPYPAFEAYKFTLEMLQNAAPRGEISGYEGIRGYQFQRDGQALWAVWSVSEALTTIIDLPAQPQVIFDMYGTPIPASQTIEVPATLFYILFPPQ